MKHELEPQLLPWEWFAPLNDKKNFFFDIRNRRERLQSGNAEAKNANPFRNRYYF